MVVSHQIMCTYVWLQGSCVLLFHDCLHDQGLCMYTRTELFGYNDCAYSYQSRIAQDEVNRELDLLLGLFTDQALKTILFFFHGLLDHLEAIAVLFLLIFVLLLIRVLRGKNAGLELQWRSVHIGQGLLSV